MVHRHGDQQSEQSQEGQLVAQEGHLGGEAEPLSGRRCWGAVGAGGRGAATIPLSLILEEREEWHWS